MPEIWLLHVMAFRLLADASVVVHILFVAFVVFGGLFVLRWPWLVWLHVPAALWGAWVEFAGAVCPLTHLEHWLRQQSGQGAYSSGFIERYLMPVLYPEGFTRNLQWVLGSAVVLVNVVVYSIVVGRRMRRR